MKDDSKRSLLQPRGLARRPVINRRATTFLVCLLIATAFWFLNALSKEYPSSLRLPVVYTNLPADQVVANRLPDSLDLELRASGFNLLRWSFVKPGDPILVDLGSARRSKSGDYHYLAFNRQLEKISQQMIRGVKVLRMQPDTLWFSYAPRTVVRVPVRPRLEVHCKPGYRSGDSMRVTPAEVEVSGPTELVQKISYVETETMRYYDVDNTVVATLRLQPPAEFRKLSFSPGAVSVEAPVYRFTEARKEIPVTVEQVPPGLRLQLFSNKVTVIYNVPLEKAESVDESMFRAVIDYRKIETGAASAKVQLVRQPSFASNVRVEPAEVGFLIRK